MDSSFFCIKSYNNKNIIFHRYLSAISNQCHIILCSFKTFIMCYVYYVKYLKYNFNLKITVKDGIIGLSIFLIV